MECRAKVRVDRSLFALRRDSTSSGPHCQVFHSSTGSEGKIRVEPRFVWCHRCLVVMSYQQKFT
jgi:hypothetical protein